MAGHCRVMLRRDEPEKRCSEEVIRRQAEKGAEFAVDERENATVVEGAYHGGDVVHQRPVPLLALPEADLGVLNGRLVGIDAVGPDLNSFQDDGEGRSLDVDGLAALPPAPAFEEDGLSLQDVPGVFHRFIVGFRGSEEVIHETALHFLAGVAEHLFRCMVCPENLSFDAAVLDRQGSVVEELLQQRGLLFQPVLRLVPGLTGRCLTQRPVPPFKQKK